MSKMLFFYIQERTGNSSYEHDGLVLQYKLDNEFELIFVVAYQKILQLSYVDKFLNDIQLEFRDKYKNELSNKDYFYQYDFSERYKSILQAVENWSKAQAKVPKQMRSFEESFKSKKTVASMIERKGEEKPAPKKKKGVVFTDDVKSSDPTKGDSDSSKDSPKSNGEINDSDAIIEANRLKFVQKMQQGGKKKEKQLVVLYGNIFWINLFNFQEKSKITYARKSW